MKPTVWTPQRKALGNLIPALVWLVPAVAGLIEMASTRRLIGPGLWLLVLATVLGWLAIDSFGLFENSKMRKALEKLLVSRKEPPLPDSPFVGFATPKYHGLLDAHEDVGFLQLFPDRLIFVSETRKVELLLRDVKIVRFRFNIHSVLLLGRWISVEGQTGEMQLRLLIESRERPTMLGNLRESSRLRERLSVWSKGG